MLEGWFFVLGLAAAIVGVVLFMSAKLRQPEDEGSFRRRLTVSLAETLRVRSPNNPTGQIMACQALLLQRAEEGLHDTIYPSLLVEALHSNWPNIPKSFFMDAVQRCIEKCAKKYPPASRPSQLSDLLQAA